MAWRMGRKLMHTLANEGWADRINHIAAVASSIPIVMKAAAAESRSYDKRDAFTKVGRAGG